MILKNINKNIPLIKSAFVKKGDDLMKAVEGLNYPLITKPVSEGSSFGMTKVNKPEELQSAYEEAIKERYRFFSFGDAMFIRP